MNRWARHHCGLDVTGRRHWRMKPFAAALRCQRQRGLLPVVICTTSIAQTRWRNGWHRRAWLLTAFAVRADRRDFLGTLPRRPLLPLVVPNWQERAHALWEADGKREGRGHAYRLRAERLLAEARDPAEPSMTDPPPL